MSTLALINNGIVTNVIVADAGYVDVTAQKTIDISQINPQPSIGWSYSSGTFTAPPVPYYGTKIKPAYFRMLFTLAEQVAIYAARSSTTSITAAGVTAPLGQFAQLLIDDVLNRLDVGVDLADPATLSYLQILEANNVIGAGRSAQIISHTVQQNEAQP